MSFVSSILRCTALPLLLKRNHQESALRHLRFLQKSQYWSRQQLLDYQWERLRKILEHAYMTTRYYRRVFDERGLTPKSFKNFEDLAKLPILTRELTFEYSEDLLSDRYARSEIQQFKSGGTTGQQAVLYRDQESFNIKLAAAWRFEGFMGRRPCDKMAQIWPAAMDYTEKGGLKQFIKNHLILRHLLYNAGPQSEEKLSAVYDKIQDFGPEYYKVFPSALYNLTRFIQDRKLKVPRIKGIVSTGEVLQDNHRKLFESVYDCEVFDLYASREVGNTSCDCSEHEYGHIVMELQYVEFINNGKPVDEGIEGEIIVTDLTNYAFPLIRYRINDYGVPVRSTCRCGRGLEMMGKVTGRVGDEIIGPDGSRYMASHLIIQLMVKGPPIGQAQVIQKSLTEFKVLITDKPAPDQSTFDYVEKEMKQLIGQDIQVSIEVVKAIPKEKSGKLLFIKSELDARQLGRLS